LVSRAKREVGTDVSSSTVAKMRAELARKIALHTRKAGEHATAIPGLTLYRRTECTPCYPATYEPSLNVFVQGRKRVTLGGTTYVCDESTFLLSSLDLPVVSQIIAASEDVPLLSMLPWSGRLLPNRSCRPAMVHCTRVASQSEKRPWIF